MILSMSEYLRFCDPVILGVLERLEVELPLGIVGVGAEPSTQGLLQVQVQTGRNPCYKLGGGSCIPCSWESQVTPGVELDVVACDSGHVKAPWGLASSGCFRSGCKVSTLGLLHPGAGSNQNKGQIYS